jgi:zinc D-Ala-D-Ala carboxypeptidase
VRIKKKGKHKMKPLKRIVGLFCFIILAGVAVPHFFAATATNASQNTACSQPLLQIGSTGNAVKELQIRIAGWASDTPSQVFLATDGIFGPATKAAVIRLQRAYGLTQDGIVGCLTWSVISAKSDGAPPHFSFSEFYSQDGMGLNGGKVDSATVRENIRRLMWKLEAFRKKEGGNPVIIVSGFRSINRNAKVGGASNSQHMFGIAADISAAGLTLDQEAAIAKTCGLSGIIIEGTHKALHVDSRVEYPSYGSPNWYWADWR